MGTLRIPGRVIEKALLESTLLKHSLRSSSVLFFVFRFVHRRKLSVATGTGGGRFPLRGSPEISAEREESHFPSAEIQKQARQTSFTQSSAGIDAKCRLTDGADARL